MPRREFNDWAKYFQIEPYNSIEIQIAQVAHILSSVNGGKSKFEDFLITSYKPKKEIDKVEFEPTDTVKSIFSAVAIAK